MLSRPGPAGGLEDSPALTAGAPVLVLWCRLRRECRTPRLTKGNGRATTKTPPAPLPLNPPSGAVVGASPWRARARAGGEQRPGGSGGQRERQRPGGSAEDIPAGSGSARSALPPHAHSSQGMGSTHTTGATTSGAGPLASRPALRVVARLQALRHFLRAFPIHAHTNQRVGRVVHGEKPRLAIPFHPKTVHDVSSRSGATASRWLLALAVFFGTLAVAAVAYGVATPRAAFVDALLHGHVVERAPGAFLVAGFGLALRLAAGVPVSSSTVALGRQRLLHGLLNAAPPCPWGPAPGARAAPGLARPHALSRARRPASRRLPGCLAAVGDVHESA